MSSAVPKSDIILALRKEHLSEGEKSENSQRTQSGKLKKEEERLHRCEQRS